MHKKELDPNRKHYFDKISAQDFGEILKSALVEQLSLTLWEAQQNEQQAEEFLPVQFSYQGPAQDQIKLEIKPHSSLIKRLLGPKLIGKEVFLKLQQGRFHYFSTARLDKGDDNKLYLLIGHEIFKSQQRANYRIQASEYIHIKLSIGEQSFKALDLSSGGISLLIPAALEEQFKPDQTYNKAVLELNRTLYNIPELKVVKTSTWNTKEIQVGIQFEKLPEKAEMRLNQQINNEARVEHLLKKRSS